MITATRLLGEVCSMRRFQTEAKLAMFCGVAPVSDDSGKRKGFHRTTHRANKVAKDAIIQIAASNQRYSPSSATYYLKKREAGLSHWQAVKCLARQLIPIPNLNVAESLIKASNRLDIIGCCNSLIKD